MEQVSRTLCLHVLFGDGRNRQTYLKRREDQHPLSLQSSLVGHIAQAPRDGRTVTSPLRRYLPRRCKRRTSRGSLEASLRSCFRRRC